MAARSREVWTSRNFRQPGGPLKFLCRWLEPTKGNDVPVSLSCGPGAADLRPAVEARHLDLSTDSPSCSSSMAFKTAIAPSRVS